MKILTKLILLGIGVYHVIENHFELLENFDFGCHLFDIFNAPRIISGIGEILDCINKFVLPH